MMVFLPLKLMSTEVNVSKASPMEIHNAQWVKELSILVAPHMVMVEE